MATHVSMPSKRLSKWPVAFPQRVAYCSSMVLGGSLGVLGLACILRHCIRLDRNQRTSVLDHLCR